MIKLIEKNKEFDDFFKDDIFYIRIMSLLKAYSTNYNFALFYKQLDDNGNITSIISRLDNDYTVCHNDDFDLIELEDYSTADFESWYVDVSHRIRHSCAKAVTLNVNDEIVSSGIFSSIYNNDAILTSVSTVPEFRRMGYGSALVSAMICDIKGKVYLMRDKNKNEKFYKKLGFENMGYWRMYK